MKLVKVILAATLIMAGTAGAAMANPEPSFSGTAHWYGKELHGNRTASGAIFDRFKLTAAHPNLPLGTKVRVRSKYTGKEVVILVNDRCPVTSKRVIDLSEGAAKVIGIWPGAPAKVDCWVLSKSEAKVLEKAAADDKHVAAAEKAPVTKPAPVKVAE